MTAYSAPILIISEAAWNYLAPSRIINALAEREPSPAEPNVYLPSQRGGQRPDRRGFRDRRINQYNIELHTHERDIEKRRARNRAAKKTRQRQRTAR